jgi:hypothetical protein
MADNYIKLTVTHERSVPIEEVPTGVPEDQRRVFRSMIRFKPVQGPRFTSFVFLFKSTDGASRARALNQYARTLHAVREALDPLSELWSYECSVYRELPGLSIPVIGEVTECLT